MISVTRPPSESSTMIVFSDENIRTMCMWQTSVFISTLTYARMFNTETKQNFVQYFKEPAGFGMMEAIHPEVAIGMTDSGFACAVTARGITACMKYEDVKCITRLTPGKLGVANETWISQVDFNTCADLVNLYTGDDYFVRCMGSHGTSCILTGLNSSTSVDHSAVAMWDFRDKNVCWKSRAVGDDHSMNVVRSVGTYVIGADEDAIMVWDARKANQVCSSIRVYDTACICPNDKSQFVAANLHQRVYTFMDVANIDRQHMLSVVRRCACIPRCAESHKGMISIICESKSELNSVNPACARQPRYPHKRGGIQFCDPGTF